MGTDIHIVTQARINGRWKDLPPEKNPPDGRNYFLFAWLANVRNGYGFAGVKTFDPVKPLTDNRGLPSDFDHQEFEYDEEGDTYRGHDLGDHSQGWATMKEILEHKRPDAIMQTGVLTKEDFNKFFESGEEPTHWSGDIWSSTIVKVTASDYVSMSPEKQARVTHVVATWARKADDSLDAFVKHCEKLAAEYGPEDCRIVFGFDS